MTNTNPPKHISRTAALGSLGALLLLCSALIAIPSLEAIKSIPMQYLNSLPVANQGDLDRDGIPDNRDASPFPVAVVAVEETETGTAALLEGELEVPVVLAE